MDIDLMNKIIDILYETYRFSKLGHGDNECNDKKG